MIKGIPSLPEVPLLVALPSVNIVDLPVLKLHTKPTATGADPFLSSFFRTT